MYMQVIILDYGKVSSKRIWQFGLFFVRDQEDKIHIHIHSRVGADWRPKEHREQRGPICHILSLIFFSHDPSAVSCRLLKRRGPCGL